MYDERMNLNEGHYLREGAAVYVARLPIMDVIKVSGVSVQVSAPLLAAASRRATSTIRLSR